MVEIVETPRDAMQGIQPFIPTRSKADYINALLKVGFDIIDFGSFVSPKAIPQLRDTAKVLEMLDIDNTKTRLLAIVGNQRGAEEAAIYDKVTYLGYPHSTSDIFLQKNINSTLEKSRKTVEALKNICSKNGKILSVYYSMCFGNPYGEEWNPEQLWQETEIMRQMGVTRIVLSDTIGVATPESIRHTFRQLVPSFPDIQFGLHIHSTMQQWYEKIDEAYKGGCRSFEGVLNGLGGCPMAGHELVGNLRTGLLLEYFEKNGIPVKIDKEAFENAITKSITTFALLKFKKF
ncbi:MAG: hydroxymethylglutaryl-CoA lyase [Bacteroidetes bacterium]|nr:hydroxymethylglutaryl-CoA lyase [Bacteroidota bacterium]